MYDKCYFCLDQLPKLKKESTASFFVNFGGAGVQKSRPTLLYLYFKGTQHTLTSSTSPSRGHTPTIFTTPSRGHTVHTH